MKGENTIYIMNNETCIREIYVYSDGNLNYLSLASSDDAKEKYFYDNISSLEDKYLLNYLDAPNDYEFSETYHDALTKFEAFMYDDSLEEVDRKIECINDEKN